MTRARGRRSTWRRGGWRDSASESCCCLRNGRSRPLLRPLATDYARLRDPARARVLLLRRRRLRAYSCRASLRLRRASFSVRAILPPAVGFGLSCAPWAACESEGPFQPLSTHLSPAFLYSCLSAA